MGRRVIKKLIVSCGLIALLCACNEKPSSIEGSVVVFSETTLQHLLAKQSNTQLNLSRTRDSLELLVERVNPEDRFGLLYMLASLELDLNESESAISRISSLLENKDINSNNLSRANQLLGTIYYNKGQYELAHQYIAIALELDSADGNIVGMVKSYSNLSSVFHAKEMYVKSLAFQRKAVQLHFRKTSEFPKNLYLGLAPIFIELDQLDSAQYYYDLVLQKADTQQIDQANLFLHLGLIQEKKNDYKSAKEYYQKALNKAKALENKSDQTLALNNLAYVNYEMGNFEEAFVFLDSAVIVDAEMRDADFAKSIQELELKYEDLARDRKLQELAFQTERDQTLKTWGGLTAIIVITALAGLFVINRKRLQNAHQLAIETDIRHQKEKDVVAMHSSIETLELERKRAAMDLHDGIGALASSVRMRVSLVDARIDKPELKEHLEKADEALQEIAQDVKRIAFNMLPSSLNHLGLIAGIEDFISKLPVTESQQIHFYADNVPIQLSEASEISVFRIAQELINNGVKYSKASDISFEITVDEHELVLLYHDNGVGLDRQSHNQGNGLRILKSRIEFLNGKLDLDSSAKNGTTFKITVPK